MSPVSWHQIIYSSCVCVLSNTVAQREEKKKDVSQGIRCVLHYGCLYVYIYEFACAFIHEHGFLHASRLIFL